MADEEVKNTEGQPSSGTQPTTESRIAPIIQSGLSKVSSNPKQSIAIVVIFSLVFGYFLYTNLFPHTEPKKPLEKHIAMPNNVVTPPADPDKKASDVPPVPELPKLIAPTPAPPPPPPPASTAQASKGPSSATPALPSTVSTAPTDLPSIGQIGNSKREEQKRKSSIVLISGVQKKSADQDEMTKNFKFRGNLNYLLGQGKIIDAVLETALNTDFGGDAKATVARDVFSEGGKVVLIPKGSKIFGTYQTGIDGAYGRIAVMWNRIDLPSGYSLNIAAHDIDNLGRKGTQGRVDNKYTEQISNAVLISAFNIAVAGLLDKVVPPPPSVNTTAGNLALASSINNTAVGITTNPQYQTLPAQQQINVICTQVPQLIQDKTSSIYTTVFNACNQAQNSPPGGNYQVALQSLMSTFAGLTSNTGQTSALAATPSQQQIASQNAFKDLSKTMKGMIDQTKFSPTITVNQGEHIKIYVNKDYLFPDDITKKVRILK